MKRQINIDILKCIGLVCIILAHCVENKIIFQIRNFDVVLMILISAKLFFDSNSKPTNIKSFFIYVWKRIQRLIIPTYIFLTILFVLNYFFQFNNWDVKKIIFSYLFLGGIGYVWIIKVYLLIAILLPIIYFIINKIGINKMMFYSIILFIVYEVLCENKILDNLIFNYFLIDIIPCVLLITISDWIRKNNNKKIIIFSIINIVIFIISGAYIFFSTGQLHNTNYMKYPFRTYYLSYALGISTILIVIFRNEINSNYIYSGFIKFVSCHSLWIYLWHILFLQFKIFDYWVFNFLLIFLESLVMVYIQNKLIEYLKSKQINKSFLKIFEG